MTKHPQQPIELDKHGTARFKRNNIIDWLFSIGKLDLNAIAIAAQQKGTLITQEDQMQLAQLLGYSVSGFGDLSYADPDVVEEADKQVTALIRLEEIKKEKTRSDWLPIETAPKDGTHILASLSWLPYPKTLFWATYSNEWRCPAVEDKNGPYFPTGWMPLPALPHSK